MYAENLKNRICRIDIYMISILLVAIEQISKMLVIKFLRNSSITIIKGILNFTYCENRGIAFSMGDGKVPAFIIVNILIIGGLIFFYEKNRSDFSGMKKIFFIMVIAGGTSNLIDRIFRGFVVDFIDINELFQFAIFNVADIFIVLGIIGLIISMAVKGMKS